MKKIKNYTYSQLIDLLIGNIVHFKSNCEFFPNFDIKCKVLSYYTTQNEIVFKVKVNMTNKIIDIGSNMKDLMFEVIKRGDL